MRVAMLVQNSMKADARVDREAAALAAAGHDVHVLALRDDSLPEREERDGFVIARVADYSTASWSSPLRKRAQLREREASFTAAAVALEPHVVHAHDTDTLVAASRAATATGAALVYDAHELYPDMAGGSGRGRGSVARRYWLGVERRTVPLADAVITVGDGVAQELADRYGVDPVVVRNVPPLRPVTKSGRLRRELDVPDSTVIFLYQGVVNQGRALPELLRALALAPKEAVLAVQGAGNATASLEVLAEQLGLSGRLFLMGHKPMDELHDYACSADVGVAIYQAGSLNNYLASPNKLFAYLMAGLPVISSAFPGLEAVVRGLDVGRTFEPLQPSSIAEAMMQMLDPELRENCAGNARRAAEAELNWERESRKLVDLYTGLEADR